MARRIGKQSILLNNPVFISNSFTCAGIKECNGPLGKCFDVHVPDDKWGEDSFEKCERKMFGCVMHGCAKCAGVKLDDIDAVLSGDLLNQTISASFSALDFGGSYIGLYGACSTMAESLALASCLIDAGAISNAICLTGSHFCTAERQYRMPLDMGTQKTPTSQMTVTGVGGAYVGGNDTGAAINAVTFGRVIDMGISDANNMGAAMAPAAADTINAHVLARNRKLEDYDAVITGDLGKLGVELLCKLLSQYGYNVKNNIIDCGCLIYSEDQDPHMGGSGCGCSAIVLNGFFLPKIKTGEYKMVLFVATGALLSTTSSMQGENIPSIAHAIEIIYTGGC